MAKTKEKYKLADGTEVDGVTTIIGNNLGWGKYGLHYYYWEKGKSGKNFGDKPEAEAGTVAHYLISSHIKERSPEIEKEFPNISPEIRQMAETGYLNFREWTTLVKFKPFLTEQPLISEKFHFGGKIDCIAFINKKLSIVDWKTGKGPYEDHLSQIASYQHLWLECNPDKPLDGGLHILLIGKENASFSHHFWSNLEEPWQVFLHLLELEKLHKKIKKLI